MDTSDRDTLVAGAGAHDHTSDGTAGAGDRRSLGELGESLAARYFTARGARVLARNWRCLDGELDLVVLEPDGTVVAVEVKTRRGVGFGDPVEAVTSAKVRRLRRLLGQWVHEHPSSAVTALRLDVVGVLVRPGRAVRVRHITGVGA